jgi:hypothetical protein
MKSKDIIIGGLYAAKVSGYWVSVRVTGQRDQERYGKIRTVFEVTNLRTGRRLTVSAARLRYPVKSLVQPSPPLPVGRRRRSKFNFDRQTGVITSHEEGYDE